MRSARAAIATLFCTLSPVPPALAQLCPAVVVEDEFEASQPSKAAAFGMQVALSGDTLAASAPLESVAGFDEAGALYVSTRSGSTWLPEARLVASPAAPLEQLGLGLDLDGDTLVGGAPFADRGGPGTGLTLVFTRSGGLWSEEAELVLPVAQAGAAFGWSLALQGDTLAVGAPYYNGVGVSSGAVFVFQRNAGVWSLDGSLEASDAAVGAFFGYSLAIDGDTLLVGAYGDGASNQGAAYVFRRGAPGWAEEGKLVEPITQPQRLFGYAVAVAGDVALVGAPSTGLVAPQPGAFHAFQRFGTTWVPTAKVQASNGAPLDFFGGVLDLDGGRLLVSARELDQAYFFIQTGGTWLQRASVTTDEVGAKRFEGLSIEGSRLLIGSPFDAVASFNAGGLARTLQVTSGLTPGVAYCTAGTSASGCQAQLAACGTPSASAPGGFVVQTTGLEGDKDGIFFFGVNGRQANTWGNGTSFQCVVPPVFRGGGIPKNGTTGLCDGLAKQDLNALWCPQCPRPSKNPGAGAVVQAQFWYRDPQSTSNQTTSLSDALEFTVQP